MEISGTTKSELDGAVRTIQRRKQGHAHQDGKIIFVLQADSACTTILQLVRVTLVATIRTHQQRVEIVHPLLDQSVHITHTEVIVVSTHP